MNFSGILIGVLTFFLIGCSILLLYMRSITLEAAVGRYFCWWAFCVDSIRKNAGNTLVGFSGCFGRQLLLEH